MYVYVYSHPEPSVFTYILIYHLHMYVAIAMYIPELKTMYSSYEIHKNTVQQKLQLTYVQCNLCMYIATYYIHSQYFTKGIQAIASLY